jgi:hypothetical protein
MAQIELQKADIGKIREVFWFRENRKSVILLGQPGSLSYGSYGRIIFTADWIFTP